MTTRPRADARNAIDGTLVATIRDFRTKTEIYPTQSPYDLARLIRMALDSDGFQIVRKGGARQATKRGARVRGYIVSDPIDLDAPLEPEAVAPSPPETGAKWDRLTDPTFQPAETCEGCRNATECFELVATGGLPKWRAERPCGSPVDSPVARLTDPIE